MWWKIPESQVVSDRVKRRGEMKMKIEIGKEFPEYFKPLYPEEFELFSHFEVTAGIPTVLFAVHDMEGEWDSQCVLSCLGAVSMETKQLSLR